MWEIAQRIKVNIMKVKPSTIGVILMVAGGIVWGAHEAAE
jgi:hypothetical protein